MTTTKLNFVGKAAESKEFRNEQLVKGAKVRYGSYDMEVPIGRYSEGRMERILASFINQFTNDDIRIVIDHPKDNNGHTCSAETLKVHIVPPLSKEEKAEQTKRAKEILKARAAQEKERKAQDKRKAQLAKKAQVSLEEAEKPKKKAKKKKTPRKRIKKNG
jgi:hypothetical protein|tara:strand:- start:432 stop:914 length:483 start_codon:yes stop_codon:yes gene_type:complete